MADILISVTFTPQYSESGLPKSSTSRLQWLNTHLTLVTKYVEDTKRETKVDSINITFHCGEYLWEHLSLATRHAPVWRCWVATRPNRDTICYREI